MAKTAVSKSADQGSTPCTPATPFWKPELKKILIEVAADHHISVKSILQYSRFEWAVKARWDAYQRMNDAGYHHRHIAAIMNRDDSTIRHAIQKIKPGDNQTVQITKARHRQLLTIERSARKLIKYPGVLGWYPKAVELEKTLHPKKRRVKRTGGKNAN